MDLGGILAVFRFECVRSLTVSRFLGWALLAFFPPILVAIVASSLVRPIDPRLWASTLFVLIPEATCLLGLLLWATPFLYSELEGKTWIYLAVRPRGRGSVMLGKYLTAVVWTASAALLAVTFTVILVKPPEPFRLWGVLSGLVVLSSFSYGALYLFIGVLFHRRATVVAVAYTLLFEFLVAYIPAMINKLTIQFRLRALLVHLLDWDEQIENLTRRGPRPNITILRELVGSEPNWLHLVVLGGTTVVLLSLTYAMLHWREFVTADEA